MEVEVDGDRIASVRAGSVHAPDLTLVPGFVDLQVNGIDDVDVARADGPDWERLDELLVAQGTTTWCPTLVTAPRSSYPTALARIAAAAGRGGIRPTIVGAHLEGPFLGGAPGAHPTALLQAIDLGWIADLPDVVRVVTLAPELDDVGAAVSLLAGRGVLVALGHTAAHASVADTAVAAGARLVTHLFNGMPAFHHRDPGPVGWALLDERLTVSLIADGVHVAAEAVRLAFAVKGSDRVALVTDAVAWRGGRIGRTPLELVDGAPRLPDGTLAGSASTMDAAVRFAVERCGLPLADAARAASTTPARLLGLGDRGRIAVGCRADLVALDEHLQVASVHLAGTRVF